MKFSFKQYIDLGDFGQHEAQISGVTGDFGYVSNVEIEVNGETIDVVALLPRDLDADIITQAENDYNEMLREQAEDRIAE